MKMSSIFADGVTGYWHFFTTGVHDNNSHFELLLNDVCVTGLSLISGSSLLLPELSLSLMLRPDFHYCQTVSG
jgi:hypothetical protein